MKFRHTAVAGNVVRLAARQDRPERVEVSSLPLEIDGLHPLDARAAELEAIEKLARGRFAGVGFARKADRVRRCAPLDGEGWWTCKQRECPACARRLSWRRKWQYVYAIQRMTHPTMILATLRSRTLDDLRETMTELRRTLVVMLRKRLRGVQGAVGTIEPKLSADGHYWAVHAHVVIDVAAVRWVTARAEWNALSKGRGRWIEDARPVSRRSPFALATYLAKGSDACPRPGTLAPAVLERLWTAIYRAQLVVSWGPHVQRGRSAPSRKKA